MTDRLAECVDRIETLLTRLESLDDSSVRDDVQDVVHCLLEFHGLAIGRMISILRGTESSASAISELTGDELVAGLLLLHGLHPDDLGDRVRQALERVRPSLASHGGDVTLLGIDEGVVRLRLLGNCHGCASSASTLENLIEAAILQSAPDVAGIQVESEGSTASPSSGFVSVDELLV